MSQTRAFVHWLSLEPPILYTNCWDMAAEALPAQLAELPVTHVCLPGSATDYARAQHLHARMAALLPRWRHIVGLTERQDVPRQPDPRVTWFHEHLLVAPAAWTIPAQRRRFDAVLQAAAARWKRHRLAAAIPRLLAVAYAHDNTPETQRYVTVLPRVLPQATWAAPPGARLSQPELQGLFGLAAVGLALSATEGGCRAVAEYQLCGLPVVSTHCRGGRCELVPPEYLRMTEDTPEAVAAAVAELQGSRPDLVRQAYLRNHQAAREEVTDALGVPLTWPTMQRLAWRPMAELTLEAITFDC